MEIACLVPALAFVAVAGYGWGGYFCLQHRVQAAADQALDAALATPDVARRQLAARMAAGQALGVQVFELDLQSGAGRPTLRIAYDASHSPVFALARLVAMPPSVIVRQASRR